MRRNVWLNRRVRRALLAGRLRRLHWLTYDHMTRLTARLLARRLRDGELLALVPPGFSAEAPDG